mmetsp:Transcript_98746/g.249246  ORF Transcript_98746/g.249246 Transcript_98746/m.249246 type:complete len:612 (-) Transcript_98746:92-1927(-)
MGVAWLLLCGISHALPVALIIWAFKWFIDSSKDERRTLAQAIGYGLFVFLCILMALIIMISPAMTGVYYNEACWYFYTLVLYPWLTHAFAPAGQSAMGAMDYVKAIQVQAIPSMGNWCLRLHLIFALGWVIGMPMQFYWTLRHDNKLVHRITGCLALTCSVGTAVTAIIQPHLPAGELHYQIDASFTMRSDDPDTVPTWKMWTPIALWTIFCAFKAYYHAYRREIPQHRMWVVRNLTGGLTVGLMRLIGVWWVQFVFPTVSTGTGILPVFRIHILLGFSVAVGIIEVYIRCYTDNGGALEEPAQQEVFNLPAKGRPEPCVLFMILSVYGLAATWYNNLLSPDVRQKLVPSLTNPMLLFELFVNFYNDTFISRTTGCCGLDLFLLLAPLMLFCTIEARRLHLRFVWLHVIMGYICAIAFSAPFFLWRRAVALTTSPKEKTADDGGRWCAPVVTFAFLNFVATLFVYSTKGELTLPIIVGWYFVLPIFLCLPSLATPSGPAVTTHLPGWAITFLKLYAIAAFLASAYGKLMAAGAVLDGSAIERPPGRSIMWDAIVTTAAAIAIVVLETPWLSAGKQTGLALFTAIAPASGFSYFLTMREAGTTGVAEGYHKL